MNNKILKTIIPLLIIVILSFALVYVLTPYGSATTPDSLSYLDIAANFKNGKGIVETDFSLKNFPHKGFIEKRDWPPLYPILISISTDKAPNTTTVSYLSAVLLSITILFTYLILRSFLNRPIALISSLALGISVPIISIYTYVWSETLFIPLLAIASWSSIQYIRYDFQSDNRKYIYAAALLISLIALAFARYIGIIYFLLLPFTYIIGRRKNKDLLWLVVASVVYGVCVGYLLLNNLIVKGSITGMDRPVSDKTVIQNIGDLYAAIHTLLPGSTMVVMIIFFISSIISVYYIRFAQKNNKKIVPENFTGIVILTFVFLVYVASLVTLRTITFFEDLNVRLFAPIFPTLWMILIILLSTLRDKKIRNILICTPVLFLVVAFLVAGWIQLFNTMVNWRELGDPKIPATEEINYRNFTANHLNNEIRKMLLPIVSDKTVLITSRPMELRFITGMTCVQLPSKINIEKINAINRLPARSIMLLTNKKQINQLNAFLGSGNILSCDIYSLKGALAIATPIKILNKSHQ